MKRADRKPVRGEALQGRLMVLEAFAAQSAWMWAYTQPHPPTALAMLLRPIEEGLQAARHDPGHNAELFEAAWSTYRDIALRIEELLHQGALFHAPPPDRPS